MRGERQARTSGTDVNMGRGSRSGNCSSERQVGNAKPLEEPSQPNSFFGIRVEGNVDAVSMIQAH